MSLGLKRTDQNSALLHLHWCNLLAKEVVVGIIVKLEAFSEWQKEKK